MPTPLIYRWLLRLCPPEFRERFGDEVIATAASMSRDRPGGRWRAFVDAARTVIGLRRDVRRERRAGAAGLLSRIAADLRLGGRSLRRVPGFSLAAILTLALGIGAFTVVYAIVDALLLRPLPFGDRSDRLVTIHSTHPSQARDWNDSELSYADLMDLRERAVTFDAVEGVIDRNFSVASADDSARVLGASVTPGLFAMLGVSPIEGRLFRSDEAALPGLESVVIVSHALWTNLLGADRSAVGRPILLNARPVTLIGVMPEGFLFPEQHQVWLPYAGNRVEGRGNRALIGFGLLRHDATMSQAAADVERVSATLAREYPDTNRDWGLHLLTLRDYHVQDRSGLTSMLAAVVLLLLVACANVAGLLIARGASRTQELVTRAALGASRGRLISLLLAEAAVIAAVGGVLGVMLSFWGLRALLAMVAELPVYWAQPAIDWRVLLTALAATVGVALLAGLVPALRLSGVDTGAAGTAVRVAGGTRGHRRVQRGLVVAQVSVSFVLLTGATLLAASAVALQRADAGFDPAQVLSGRFYIAGDPYDPIEARAAVVSKIAETVAAIPGVTAAAVTQAIPADDGGSTVLVRPPDAGATESMGVTAIAATPGLWDTLGLRLLAGRTFTAAEHADDEAPVVIVNERLAHRFWPGQSALDRPLPVVNARGEITTTLRVVGVAPNLVYEEFGETTPQSQLNLYIPYARQGGRTMAILARASGDPAPLSQALRQAVRAVDPSFATFDVLTLTERRRLTTWGERFLATTFTVFALLALLLACLGTFAVVAYAVAQRRREVGVRLAIGATPVDVVGLFLKGGLALAAVGLCLGAPLAALTARALDSGEMLFGVSPWDGRLWIALPAALLAAVLVATLQPALRAGRVAPVEVLRE